MKAPKENENIIFKLGFKGFWKRDILDIIFEIPLKSKWYVIEDTSAYSTCLLKQIKTITLKIKVFAFH